MDDDSNVIGLNDNIDELQLKIKDRIKNNILPTTFGLFDIEVKEYDDKKYLHIIMANGNEKPYYLKKYCMTNDGCYICIKRNTRKNY